ncbi:MAG: hypothetical protein IPP46_09635 [Bacteroidetes bacterium]|nr:hypothetical protein [Bacteroidota bacterium]
MKDGLASDYIQSVVEDKDGEHLVLEQVPVSPVMMEIAVHLQASPDIKDKENKKHLKSFPGIRNGC